MSKKLPCVSMSRCVWMPRAILTIVSFGALATMARGQGQIQEVPNPMAVHTYFIILFAAVFLAWAVSFSLHTMKERSGTRKDYTLQNLRESLLDEIVQLEFEKESGELAEDEYRKRMKSLRGELSSVIEKLKTASKPKKKHA